MGYDFTEKMTNINRVGCFAHVCRKFFEAQKASIHKKSIPGTALTRIQKLYRVDEGLEKIPIDERTELRKRNAVPVLFEFKSF